MFQGDAVTPLFSRVPRKDAGMLTRRARQMTTTQTSNDLSAGAGVVVVTTKQSACHLV